MELSIRFTKLSSQYLQLSKVQKLVMRRDLCLLWHIRLYYEHLILLDHGLQLPSNTFRRIYRYMVAKSVGTIVETPLHQCPYSVSTPKTRNCNCNFSLYINKKYLIIFHYLAYNIFLFSVKSKLIYYFLLLANYFLSIILLCS